MEPGKWICWPLSVVVEHGDVIFSGGGRVGGVREVAAPFVVPGPSGVAIRDRLKGLTPEDEMVLRLAGDHRSGR